MQLACTTAHFACPTYAVHVRLPALCVCVCHSYEPSLRALFAYLQPKAGIAAGKKLLTFESWRMLLRRTRAVGADLSERDAALAFVWSRMAVAEPYSEKGVVRLLHLPFESFLEALCRCARRKAFPTDDEIAEAGFDHAGTFMDDLRENHPAALDQLMRTRTTPWGAPLSGPPLARCVEHFLCMLIHTIASAGSKNPKLDLNDRKLETFFQRE